MIEKGRYKGIPVDDRLCTEYNMLEDELHLVMLCNKLARYVYPGNWSSPTAGGIYNHKSQVTSLVLVDTGQSAILRIAPRGVVRSASSTAKCS